MSQDLVAGVTCHTSDCNQKCPKGTNQVAQVSGNPGQLSTADQCSKGQYRNVCCDDGTLMGICTWRGYRGAGLSCVKGCQDGETEVLTDTSYHDKKGNYKCTGGLQSYCCAGFKPAPSKKQLEQEAADAAKAAAEQAAEQAALDIAAKAFCRIAVPALLLPLELLEDLIPIVGEILDLVEVAATPALIQLCVKDVEKAGKAEFKVFGKTRTIDGFTKPTEKPTSRPSESSHSSAKTSDDGCGTGANAKRAPVRNCRYIQSTTTTTVLSAAPAHTGSFECVYALHSQACLAYSSAINNNAALRHVTCPYKKPDSQKRPAVNQYNLERAAGMNAWIALIPNYAAIRGGGCERDEWPPALFLEANNGRNNLEGGQLDVDRTQYIRLDPKRDNSDAGKLWLGLCPPIAEHDRDQGVVSIKDAVAAGGRRTQVTKYRATYTRSVFSIDFNMAGYVDDGDDGLSINPCIPVRPNDNNNYRGYAMLFSDPYFPGHPQYDFRGLWAKAPTKRDLESLHPEEIFVADGNDTRPATKDELWRDFGMAECEDSTCSKELEGKDPDSVRVIGGLSQDIPRFLQHSSEAETTVVSVSTPTARSSPERAVLSAYLPERTGAV